MLRALSLLAVMALLCTACAANNNTSQPKPTTAATQQAPATLAPVVTQAAATKPPAATKAPPPNIGTLAAGSEATTKQWRVNLVSITDPYGGTVAKPADGNRWVAYHVTLTNNGSQEQSIIGQSAFKLKTADSHVYGTSIANPDGQFLKAIKVGKGEITEGNVYFQIPLSATPVELHLDTGLGTDDIYFRVQ